MQKDYSNEAVLVEAIYQKDPGAYEYMRVNYYSLVEFVVRGNRASKEDVEDIFSEGMFAVADKAYKGTLDTSARLSTFLFTVWKNQWQKELNIEDDHLIKQVLRNPLGIFSEW